MKIDNKSNKKRKESKQKTTKRLFKKIKETKSKKEQKEKKVFKKDNLKQEYPMRLSRHLFLKGICSRRKADIFIQNGWVKVNGKKAKLGQKIQKTDKVELSEEAKKENKDIVYVVFNKPVGVVSHNPQEGEKEPADFIKEYKKLSPVGRLDKKSTGLLLLSNDGVFVDKMLNPKYNHQKEYIVEVDKYMTGEFFKKMESGVKIERYKTKPAKIKKVKTRTFSLILTEGKKHQIRRMCAALGYTVLGLKRVRFMNIKLGNLKVGEYKVLSQKEIDELKKSIK
ncbi:23S rRNA pseudouridine synthase F [Candidatus Campbellbacteria bacterium]|nr:MAG: 23S rRNA pseudouridine synthase F [Candidatus Campbellbacteria bacterium]